MHDPAGLVDGYGKTYAFGTGVYRCVDTDKHPFDIQQRAAAVAGIDGRIGLHKVGKCSRSLLRMGRQEAETTPVGAFVSFKPRDCQWQ